MNLRGVFRRRMGYVTKKMRERGKEREEKRKCKERPNKIKVIIM